MSEYDNLLNTLLAVITVVHHIKGSSMKFSGETAVRKCFIVVIAIHISNRISRSPEEVKARQD